MIFLVSAQVSMCNFTPSETKVHWDADKLAKSFGWSGTPRRLRLLFPLCPTAVTTEMKMKAAAKNKLVSGK